MINLKNVVNSPSLNAQSYLIIRSTGSWVAGVWTNIPSTVNGFGIVQPATDNDLKMVPEGDRVAGMMMFHSSFELFETHSTSTTDPTQGISDLIVWRTQQFRLLAVKPWLDYGYFRAFGVRISGQ